MKTACKFRVMGVESVDHKVDVKREFITKEEWDLVPERERGVEYAPNPDKRLGGGGEPRHYKLVWSGKYAQNVRLAAQYDTTNPEDVSFAEATPSGELKIYVSNPVVVGSFEPGRDYYLHLIPC